MNYYERNTHRNVKASWEREREFITDPAAIAIGDDVVSSRMISWNMIGAFLKVLEMAPRASDKNFSEFFGEISREKSA